MLTLQRGNAGEAAVLNALVRRGFETLIPFGGGHAYDLVVDLGAAFLRVQCKTAWPSGGCLLFNAYATDHGRGELSYEGRAEVFGVHFPVNDLVYIVPVNEVRRAGRLRLTPTRNNQRRRVRFAFDYEIDRWPVERLRALALAAVQLEIAS